MGATKDIKLVFGVALGEDGSPDSAKIIHDDLQNIVNELNKNPFKIAFSADESSLEKLKTELTTLASSLKLDKLEIAATQLASNGGTTEVAKQQAEVEKAASESKRRSASADREAAKASEERKISLEQFLRVYENLLRLQNQNTHMKDTEQFKNLTATISQLTPTYEALRTETVALDNIMEQLGADGVRAFDSAKVSANQLKAAIQNTSDGVKVQDVLSKINQIDSLMGKNRETMLGSTEWNNLEGTLTRLRSLLTEDKTAFIQLETNTQEAANKISQAMRMASIEAEIFKGAIKAPASELAYMDVLTQIDKIGKLMQKNSSEVLKGTETWKNLEAVFTELNSYVDRTNNSFTNLATEVSGDGTKVSQALEKSKFEMMNFNNALNLVEKETTESGMSLDKLIIKINQLKRASNTAQGLGMAADEGSQLRQVMSYIDQLQKVEQRMSSSGGSVQSNIGALGFKPTLINDAVVAYQRLNTAIIDYKANEAGAISTTDNANVSEKERQRLLMQSYGVLNKVQTALKEWTRASTGKSVNNYNQIKEYSSALQNLIGRFKNGNIEVADFQKSLNQIKNGFAQNAAVIKDCGENVASFSTRLANVARHFSMWISLSSMIMRAIRSIREMVSASIELDDAMTQLKIVTKQSEDVYKDFGVTIADVAKRTASSVSDIVSSATTYARLGYSLEEATKIAEYTAKLQNVGDIQVTDAQDAITAILKAYDGIDANHIEDVMNKLVVTGNNFPISVSQIAEGMNNASSALAAAGNTFEQSVALLTAANTTLQDAAKSSTALRTIAARIRKTDTELDALGESMTSSKYDRLVKSLADLDVALVDMNGEYRATYFIMEDIAAKWDTMTTMEQAALADAIAGTRQQAAFFSIIEQFQEASGAMEAMAGSAGELDEAYSTYLESTTAHINQFKAAFQQLSSDTFSTGFLNTLVDIGRALLEFTDALVRTRTVLLTLSAAIGIANFVKWRITIAQDVAQAEVLASTLLKEKVVTDELSVSIAALNARQLEVVRARVLATAASGELTYNESREIITNLELAASEGALEAQNFSLATSFKAVTASIPVWGWALIALGVLIPVMGSAINKAEEMRTAFQKSTDEYIEQKSVLDDYQKSIDNILDSEDDESEKLKELGRIKDELNDKYGLQIQNIRNEAEAREALSKAIEDENKKKRSEYLNEQEDAFDDAVKKVTDFKSDMTKNNLKTGMQDYGSFTLRTNNFRKDMKDLNISQEMLDLFDSTPNTRAGSFTFGKDAKNEIEYLDKLKELYIELGKIKRRNEASGTITEDELALYDKVEKQYNMLVDDLTGGDIDLKKLIFEYATDKAEELIEETPRATMSLEDWRKALIENANGNQFVIDKIIELTEESTKAADIITEDVIGKINSDLDTLGAKLDAVKESIGAANDYFEDLAKVIKSNNDTDKFFSASEMVELLDKYPELNDAILVTEYGYKLEKDAVEELREAKLNEQKDAIRSQILETEALYGSVQNRLANYLAEIDGIDDLASAKARLALLEVELADVQERSDRAPSPHSKARANAVRDEYIQVKNIIQAFEDSANYEKTLHKLEAQYSVLGSVFDDLKDKTQDTNKELSAQKDRLKDLADEYKDAQNAIEDLIKLTMDMIKKNLELEKENLKTQIENYKKIADKRKEYIDSLKAEKNFKDGLAEQNKNLLTIQQELDALSVEGVDYSLEDMKRKAELEDQLAEKSKDREDFLFDHEIDTRKDAIDKETEAYTEALETRIKELENALSKEGVIRQQAVDLINGKTQAFYNDLLDYTMIFTNKSRFEFDKLWSDAYAAIEKYSQGQLDVDMALAYLAMEIENCENLIKRLEEAANKTKSAMKDMADETSVEMNKLGNELERVGKMYRELGNPPTLKVGDLKSPSSLMKANGTLAEWMSKATKYHTGGVVENKGLTKNGEVLAKLMAGEVVITPTQATNFMKNTLPKLATANTVNNQMSPTITIGDINITGDADSSIISKLNQARQEIVDGVLKAVNNQTRIFNGGRVRTI